MTDLLAALGLAVDNARADRRAAECVCVVSCADHPPTACSLSGDLHVHPNRHPGDVFGSCPVHPDAPGDL